MQVVFFQKNDVHILALHGKMDATSTDDFENACRARLNDGAPKIVLDMEQLDYISSAGLRSILIIAKACKQSSAILALCSLHQNILEVFMISGFSSMLPIYANRADALRQLA